VNFFYDENTYQKGHLNNENIKWSISCEKWEMKLFNKGNVRDLQKLFVVIHREISSNEGIHEHYKDHFLDECDVIVSSIRYLENMKCLLAMNNGKN